MARKVVSILGGRELELVHNHHNFAWREQHAGRDVVVVRKGATPAFPGQKGFIGGSMGDDAVIMQGTSAPGSPIEQFQKAAMFSTVHGAGRVMSRTQAAGKRNRRTGRVIARGSVTPEMMHAWVRERGVILRGGGTDESPHVYRRLPRVLEAQKGTIEVVHILHPLIVVMAGGDTFESIQRLSGAPGAAFESLDVLDDEHVDRGSPRLELQPELLLECGEYRGAGVGVRVGHESAWCDQQRLCERELVIEPAGQARRVPHQPVDGGAPRGACATSRGAAG